MDKKIVAAYTAFVQAMIGSYYPNEDMLPFREEDKAAIDSELESFNEEKGVGANCAQIIKLKFGLDGNGKRTNTNIAKALGTSKNSIGYWSKKVVRRLRFPGRVTALHCLYRKGLQKRFDRAERFYDGMIRELESALDQCRKEVGNYRRSECFGVDWHKVRIDELKLFRIDVIHTLNNCGVTTLWGLTQKSEDELRSAGLKNEYIQRINEFLTEYGLELTRHRMSLMSVL